VRQPAVRRTGRTGPALRRHDEGVDGAADVPVLRDALVQVEGRISECKEVGSHSVMFVELTKVGVREPRASLVYFNRLFHRLEHAGAHC
jgi:flavin reductase (NADH)